VSVNCPVCPLSKYVPDASKFPVSFTVMTFPTTWPVPFKTLLLILVIVMPACAASTVSTRASNPVTLTLLPLTEPLRVSEASWPGVRLVPISPVRPIGLYEIKQLVCVIVTVPLPLIPLLNESVSTGETIE
jgi:hypothetical protein